MILLLLALSTLVDGLDATIVNVALPTMTKDFSISIADSSWIPIAYTVAMASLILPFALIARNGWMKEFLIFGMIIFTVCSVICGLSDFFLMFLISRLLQGVGAAMIPAASPLMIAYLLPADYKGSMWFFAVLAFVAMICALVVPNIVPKKD